MNVGMALCIFVRASLNAEHLLQLDWNVFAHALESMNCKFLAEKSQNSHFTPPRRLLGRIHEWLLHWTQNNFQNLRTHLAAWYIYNCHRERVDEMAAATVLEWNVWGNVWIGHYTLATESMTSLPGESAPRQRRSIGEPNDWIRTDQNILQQRPGLTGHHRTSVQALGLTQQSDVD